MATKELYLSPEAATLPTAVSWAQFQRVQGSNFPVSGLAYDGAGTTIENAYWKFSPILYGSGSLTVYIRWYATSGTTGTVAWGGALAAVTPETDTQDVETKSFGTAGTVTDTHLGTTAKRLHEATLTISDVNSLAAGDEVWLRVYRDPANDTMTADAVLTSLRVTYSDT